MSNTSFTIRLTQSGDEPVRFTALDEETGVEIEGEEANLSVAALEAVIALVTSRVVVQ